MTTFAKPNYVWNNNVQVEMFSEETQIAYSIYKDAQRKAAEARKAFEDLALAQMSVPQGHQVAFGYKFGKLSIGIAKGEAQVKAAKPSMSLDAWMQQQANGGYAS